MYNICKMTIHIDELTVIIVQTKSYCIIPSCWYWLPSPCGREWHAFRTGCALKHNLVIKCLIKCQLSDHWPWAVDLQGWTLDRPVDASIWVNAISMFTCWLIRLLPLLLELWTSNRCPFLLTFVESTAVYYIDVNIHVSITVCNVYILSDDRPEASNCCTAKSKLSWHFLVRCSIMYLMIDTKPF